MKINITAFIALLIAIGLSNNLKADEELSPYLKVGTENGTMGDAVSKVESLL